MSWPRPARMWLSTGAAASRRWSSFTVVDRGPHGDDLVLVAVDEREGQREDVVDRGRLRAEERQTAAHERGRGREPMRPQGGIEERAGAAIAEAGQVDTVRVDVQEREHLVQEDGDGRGRGLLPPRPTRLRKEGEEPARLERVTHALDGGDRPARPAAEHDEERERLVAAVVLGHVEDVGPSAEAGSSWCAASPRAPGRSGAGRGGPGPASRAWRRRSRPAAALQGRAPRARAPRARSEEAARSAAGRPRPRRPRRDRDRSARVPAGGARPRPGPARGFARPGCAGADPAASIQEAQQVEGRGGEPVPVEHGEGLSLQTRNAGFQERLQRDRVDGERVGNQEGREHALAGLAVAEPAGDPLAPTALAALDPHGLVHGGARAAWRRCPRRRAGRGTRSPRRTRDRTRMVLPRRRRRSRRQLSPAIVSDPAAWNDSPRAPGLFQRSRAPGETGGSGGQLADVRQKLAPGFAQDARPAGGPRRWP